MGHVDRSVFISYRRTDHYMALATSQHLTAHGYDVFINVKGLSGGDFESAILDNIKTRAHFVVVLTPSALDGCNNPADWLRREIETALQCQRNVVPLTFDGFDFKRPEVAGLLTGQLEAVKHYNAVSVPESYFDAAMERLRKYLDVPLDTVRHPASRAAQQMSNAQQSAAHSAPPVQQSDLSAERWFERGYDASDRDKQIRCYTEAIRLKPDYSYAFFNRAAERADKGDLRGALEDYDRVAVLDPSFTATYLVRGNLRSRLGDLQGALDDRDALTRLVP
jgi:tetratricopeptide (TPR) repeat protein